MATFGEVSLSKIWGNVLQCLEFGSGASTELPVKPLWASPLELLDLWASRSQGQAQRSCSVTNCQPLRNSEVPAGQGLCFMEEKMGGWGRGAPGWWLSGDHLVQPGPGPNSLTLMPAAPPTPMG